MATNLSPEELAWLNQQQGTPGGISGGDWDPTLSHMPGTVTDAGGQTWHPNLGVGGGTVDGYNRDLVAGQHGAGSQYEKYSTAGEDLGVATVASSSFMDDWGPFMLAALPFAASMAPELMAGLGGTESGVTASGVTVGGPMSVGGAVGTDLGVGAGITGAGAAATGAAFPGAAASADIVAPAGLGSAAGTTGTLAAGAGGAGASVLGSDLARGIAGVGSIGMGLAGLNKAGQLNDPTKNGTNIADPFGPERSKYGKMLSDLMADPSSITKMPGWQAGSTAVQRAGAAQGFTNSGNMAAALQQYGGDFFNNTVTQLGNLAGAQFSPATAGQLQGQGQTNSANMTGQAIGSLTQGASSLFQLAGV